MNNTQDNNPVSSALACNMMALSPQERTIHQERLARLFGALVQERLELPDGFAFRFDGEHYSLVGDFIRFERLCCPFLSFGLDLAPHNGPIWLRLTGQTDIKAFLEAEIGQYKLSEQK